MVSGDPSRHPLGMNTHTTHIPEIPEVRRLQRSRSDRMLAGVSGGLARYFEIHPAVFRVGFVVLTLLGGAGVLIYLAAALVMPDEGKQDSIATAALRDRRDRPWPLIGLGLLAVGRCHPPLAYHPVAQRRRLVALLVAGGRDPLDHAVTLRLTLPLDATELAAEDSRRVRRALRRTAIVLASLVALVLVAAAVFAAVFHVHIGRGIGDRQYAVTSVQELDQRLFARHRLDRARPRRAPVAAGRDAHRRERRRRRPPDHRPCRTSALRVHAEAEAGYVEVLEGD